MASSSFSAATSIKKYDVFISFRGEDTRDNFTSHLHAALLRHKIETYMDHKLEKGDEVWVSLVEAIHDSSVFLVIFSENYASSTWCLNELIEIMECKKKGRYVIPIFYRIEPSHVRKQLGSYEKSFHKHEMDFKHNNETMQKWKDNLTEAANTAGFHSNSHEYRDESDMIDSIIKLVLEKLNSNRCYELSGCFIQDENYAKIISLLSINSTDVRIIGIWGMGGIGKTTIAEAVFSEVASLFEGVCFFVNLREQSKTHGLNHIYSRILSKLLGEDLHIDTPKLIPSFILKRLSRKKVFIVLDDVNSIDLIHNCVGMGNGWLGAGSRVIVTTRDKQVLIKGGVHKIHEVKEMNIQNSLQLFSFYAFKNGNPKKGYEELSKRAIVYANGVPLALKILGSLLHSKGKNEWKSALIKLKKFRPNPEIQKALSLSYNELDETDKNIFFDIVRFFKSHDIDSNNRIKMYDMIQEMGHQNVCGASINNLGQETRLWDFQEVCDELTNKKGTKAIESIVLDFSQNGDIHYFSSHDAFIKMPNLRLLAFKDNWRSNNTVSISGSFKLLKGLRFLRLDNYPFKSIPSFCRMDKLVVLSMPCSKVEKLWNGVQKFPSLKKIELRYSLRLRECPNLCGAPNLEFLCLKGCENLRHIDASVFSLPKLELLNVAGCKKLKSLCSNT